MELHSVMFSERTQWAKTEIQKNPLNYSATSSDHFEQESAPEKASERHRPPEKLIIIQEQSI